jgi:hypothetical protein
VVNNIPALASRLNGLTTPKVASFHSQPKQPAEPVRHSPASCRRWVVRQSGFLGLRDERPLIRFAHPGLKSWARARPFSGCVARCATW